MSCTPRRPRAPVLRWGGTPSGGRLGLPFLLTGSLFLGAQACGHQSSPPRVDLVVDGNHSGLLELDDPTEDTPVGIIGRAAVLLANLDDDDGDGTADAEDEALNGGADLDDLSPLALAPWPGAPEAARVRIDLDASAAGTVRLYRLAPGADPKQLGSWSLVTLPLDVSADALRTGVSFAVEGMTLVTSTQTGAFDGRVKVTATLDEATARGFGASAVTSDTAVLRIAPVLFQYNTAPTRRIFYTDAGQYTASLAAGIAPMAGTVPVEGIDLREFGADDDVWMQDFIDFGVMTRPAAGGTLKQIRIAIRSAQTDRTAGTIAQDKFRGVDYASFAISDPNGPASDESYSMSSFGNFEVVPPYEKGGVAYPLGRNLWGSTGKAATSPDPSYTDFVHAQAVQPEITVDTSWLLVGHVDEFTSFVQAKSARGFVLLVGDPGKARTMLTAARDGGGGSTRLFVDRMSLDWNTGAQTPADRAIADVLTDADLMASSQLAASRIDEAVQHLKTEIGLSDDEIVPMPFLFEQVMGSALAWIPGTVNLLHIDGRVVIPDPFGPQVGGSDLFKADLLARLMPLGLSVGFADDWYAYHENAGEVHCGSNVERELTTPWWEGSR